jgi:hypothetical protein
MGAGLPAEEQMDALHTQHDYGERAFEVGEQFQAGSLPVCARRGLD